MNGLDESIDPCKDFYQFSCGGWMAKTKLTRGSKSVFGTNEEIMEFNIAEMLSKPSKPNDTRWRKLLKTYYNSCMKSSQKDIKHIFGYLKELGGWPVVEGSKWDASKFDFITTSNKIKEIQGVPSTFLTLDTTVSEGERKNVVFIGRPSLWLRTLDVKDSTALAYLEKMVKVAVKFGANREFATRDLRQVLEAEAFLTGLFYRESRWSYELFFIAVRMYFSGFDISRFLNSMVGRKFSFKDTVRLQNAAWNMNSFLTKFDNRTLANYLIWRFVSNTLDLLPRDSARELVGGPGVLMERHEFCSKLTKNQNLLVLREYVVSYKFQEKKKEVLKMKDAVLGQLLKFIQSSTTVKNEALRRTLIEKAKNIQFELVYPDELLDEDVLTKHFQNYTLSETKYIENVFKTNKMLNNFKFTHFLSRPYARLQWERFIENLFDANAFAVLSTKIVSVTLAMIHGAFFGLEYPRYLNYAGIGMTLGHEMTHHFDCNGYRYSLEGELVWDDESKKAFVKTWQCLAEQYSNYSFSELKLHLNGTNELRENIADNGGLRMAYYAYLNWTAQHGEEGGLPGLKYSPRQLFWINFGHTFCHKYSKSYVSSLIRGNPHTPSPFRVNVPLSNYEEFARDFQCPVGSPMNPVKKCRVW